MRTILVGSCLAALAAAQGLRPTVTISHGVIVGDRNFLQGQERFLGIPFAQPPTGQNRLRAPQSLTTNFGTLTATISPSACPQLGGATTIASPVTAAGPIATGDTNVFKIYAAQPTAASNPEDCLYLNVQRPAGTNSTSRLPVLVWIFGGGFQIGSASPIYDNGLMLGKAMALKSPYIFVAMNYRVAAFGFLASRQLADEGNTNLGLRDQRAALEWVADNIEAFGGDSEKVTIWGESAGSWSVMDQTIINRGDNTYKGKPLFRGAMMNSGATFPALEVSHPKPQGIFDKLAKAAGCDPTSSTVMSCLRSVDYNKFLAAQNAQVLPNAGISLSFIARPDPSSDFFPTSPEAAVIKGEFAKVSIICGNQQDEGAFFGSQLKGIDGNSDDDLLKTFNPVFPEAANSTLIALGNTYPKDITAGCPFYTGIFNEIYSGYKRLSALIGDTVFILARRTYLDAVSSSVNAWSFISTYDSGVPVLGTTHITDILAMYFGLASPIAVDQMFTRYISFIVHGDPNKLNPWWSAAWPQYNTTDRALISFDGFGVSFPKDNFRPDSYAALKANQTQLRM